MGTGDVVGISGAFGSKGSLPEAVDIVGFGGVFGSRGSTAGVFIDEPSEDDAAEGFAAPTVNSGAAWAKSVSHNAKAADRINRGMQGLRCMLQGAKTQE